MRRKTIGGSDAAAIVELNDYVSPFALYQNKIGTVPDKENNLAMEFGHFAEEFVVQQFENETGKKCRREWHIIYNSKYPFAHANLDRRIVGENAGLECKTTSVLNLRKFKDGDYPAVYYVQCVHYMAVCGFDRMYLAVLIGNSEFRYFTIERDEDEINALMAAESDFYGCMVNRHPPAVKGCQSDSDALITMFPADNAVEIDLFGRDGLFAELESLETEKKVLDCKIDEIKNTLKSDLGEAVRGNATDYYCVWKTQQRKTVDTERLFKEHPEIDADGYIKYSNFRVFRTGKIKKTKEVI